MNEVYQSFLIDLVNQEDLEFIEIFCEITDKYENEMRNTIEYFTPPT